MGDTQETKGATVAVLVYNTSTGPCLTYKPNTVKHFKQYHNYDVHKFVFTKVTEKLTKKIKE